MFPYPPFNSLLKQNLYQYYLGLFCISIVILMVLLSHFYFQQIGDDGYIYFRYVERALNGAFGSWSDGIEPVEGYSSPLWYGLLIILTYLLGDVVVSAQVLGLIFSFITVFLLYQLSIQLGASSLRALLTCVVFILIEGFHYWSTSGLETAFYIAVFLATTSALIVDRYVLFMLSILLFARPEGVFLAPLLFLCYWLVKPNKRNLLALMIFSCVFVFGLCLRWICYESLLPNTFYAKASAGSINQLIRGTIYCLPILFMFLWLWFCQWISPKQSHLIALGAASWLLAIVIGGGGDWMLHFRLLLPILAVMLAILMAKSFSSKLMIAASIMVTLPITLLMISPQQFMMALQGKQLPIVFYQEGSMTHESKTLAKKIEARYRKLPLKIAVNHAGALPFWLKEHQFIDMVGLNNKVIARTVGELHAKYAVGYVLAQKPDLVILNTRQEPTQLAPYQTGYWIGETALFEHEDFQQFYRFSGLFVKWHWQIAWPYHLIYPGYPTSWILVYERINHVE